MNPLFSIIVPVYNVEAYLDECIDSVTRQTYKNYEIIIVDDGSTDESPKICDLLREKDKRIRVIHQNNQGQSKARNTGIRQAKGDYLIFLDSDDFWKDDEYLMKLQFEIFSKAQPDLIVITSYTYYNDKTGEKKIITSDVNYKVLNQLSYEDSLYCVAGSSYFPMSPWSKIVKRKIIEEHSLFFEPGLRQGEDIDWVFDILLICNTIHFMKESNYIYRGRNNSVSHSVKEKTYRDLYFIVEKWSEQLKNMSDTKLRQAVLGCLAYQFYILIGVRRILGNFDQYQEELAKVKWVMEYSLNRKSLLCKKVIKCLGFDKGSYFMAAYMKRKIR